MPQESTTLTTRERTASSRGTRASPANAERTATPLTPPTRRSPCLHHRRQPRSPASTAGSSRRSRCLSSCPAASSARRRFGRASRLAKTDRRRASARSGACSSCQHRANCSPAESSTRSQSWPPQARRRPSASAASQRPGCFGAAPAPPWPPPASRTAAAPRPHCRSRRGRSPRRRAARTPRVPRRWARSRPWRRRGRSSSAAAARSSAGATPRPRPPPPTRGLAPRPGTASRAAGSSYRAARGEPGGGGPRRGAACAPWACRARTPPPPSRPLLPHGSS
mmetsp:Transcript_31990/g.105913  ORF Transcript_31990/g.105913 Transcript_31990/m.105913 type:complete len:280 (+) Transcript_31990:184-1023(+)